MGTRVYVGRLSYDCREKDLQKFFKGYGKIREILIKNGFGFVEFDDPRDADDAVYELNGKDFLGERVILEIARGPVRRTDGKFGFRRRGSWLDKIHVEIARGPRSRDDSWNSWGRNRNRRTPVRRWGRQEKYGPPTRTEYRLIVENLSSKVSWQDLKDYMRQAGEVTYADAHKQRRNEGVVEFASYADMKSAYNKLNNTDLSGRKIKLVEDRPHRSRRSHSRSSSRSRSRSRSKSRSRSRSRSARRSRSRSKSAGKSRSRSRSMSRSRSKSMSKSPAKSMSKSPAKAPREKSRSASPGKSDKSDAGSRGSRSRSRSRSRSMSRSKSPIDEGKVENN